MGNVMEYIGKSIRLCLVSIEDYEFIHSIRVLPSSIKFLSQVDNNPLLQKVWLEGYKKRELAAGSNSVWLPTVPTSQNWKV